MSDTIPDLVSETEVMERLKILDGRPNREAARRALDRLWANAQDVRRAHRKPPLRRVCTGRRYAYTAETVAELIEALSFK